MASKRAVLRAAALLIALAAATGAAGNVALAAQNARRVLVISLPETAARDLVDDESLGLGLGVFPSSRDPIRFLLEIGRGAPSADDQVFENRLAAGLRRAGTFVTGNLSEGPGAEREVLRTVFDPQPSGTPGNPSADELQIHSVDSVAEAEALLRSGADAAVLLGIGEGTPVLVGVTRRTPGGLLTGSITRRPGIITPYDVTATVLELVGAAVPEEIAGNVLTVRPDLDARAKIDSLAARLERDDSYAPGLAAVAVGTGGLLVIIGWFISRGGRTALAMRLAQAAVFVLPGWVLAEFIPSAAWGVRAIPVFAGALLGGAMNPRNPIRTMARAGFGSAAVFAVLVAIAPLNPGGEPGLSIWGNPLVSWRFFGMQNVQAAIIASGVVVWGVLAGLAAPALAVLAVGAAVVTGAPTIGANFVGVLTFVFGAAVAVTVLVQRRARFGHVAASALIAAGAFFLALVADAGSPVSHGGRAARRISNDGWSAAWDLIEGRLRLNVELIGDFTGGWIFVALLLVTLIALIAWGIRAGGPFPGRVAVLAGALMALTSLVLEDSGFYSGAVLWFVAADAWLLVTLAERSRVTPQQSVAPTGADG